MKSWIISALVAEAVSVAAAEPKGKPALPSLPDVLKTAKASLSSRPDVGVVLALTSETPLTPEQWAAVESLHLRAFNLSGNVSDDAGMAHLAKMDPVSLQFSHSPMTDAGAAKFAEMKSLKVLRMSHTDKLTPASALALANHPSLEVFANDGKFGIGGMAQIATAKHLRDVLLQHGVASDANVALLAKHPSLETVRLWPRGGATLTDAAIASLATIPNLQDLSLDYSAFTYAGGLNRLKEIPKLAKLSMTEVLISDEDLAKLKADLPTVTITVKPMTAEYKKQWDEWTARRK